MMLVLSACMGKPLNPEVKQKIKTTEVRLIIKQPEIYGAVVHNNNNAIGGIFGTVTAVASISAKEERVKRNEKAIKPVVKALKGYKVQSLAKQVYAAGLKRVEWMSPSTVKVVNRDLSTEERNEITRKSKADAVIFVDVDYRLNETFKSLEVNTRSQMYHEHARASGAEPDIIYRAYHTYKWDLPNNADGIYDHHKLGKKWSKNRAKVLKSKIREGLEEEVKFLVSELHKS